MVLPDIYLGLGEGNFAELLKSISIGKLKTFQLLERMKLRLRIAKLNSETLRKSAKPLWARLEAKDDDLAQDLAQAILVSHFPMVIDVLNFLGIPHEDGFFAKDISAANLLTEGWQQRVWNEFRGRYPDWALGFYVNHLAFELSKPESIFEPA